jgi:hypothetical protein
MVAKPPRKGNPFEFAIFTRLDWANAQVDRLDKAAKAFLQDQVVTTTIETNADATEYVIRVDKGVDRIPDEIPLMIGDVAHCARAALDWLAWSVARNPGKDTSFPIWTSPSINSGTRKIIQPFIAGGTTPTVKRLVKQVQPYVALQSDPTAHPLYWLRELDNIHKHRHLVAAACSDGGHFRTIPNSIHGTAHVQNSPSELEAGSEICRLIFSEPNPEFQFEYHPEPYIGVREIAPSLAGNIVAELRYDMIDYARKIVAAFSECGCLRR